MGPCCSKERTADPATTGTAFTAAVSVNPLKIGATIPNFAVQSTQGDFYLHDFLTQDKRKPWTIFFSHPKDYTPVCTTELGACHCRAPRFADMCAKLIGISCDSVADHLGWTKDVLHRIGKAGDESLAFPIIADADRSIVTNLGMLDPEERDAAGVPLPARALTILYGTTVKLTILYPATTGRNFDEIARVLTSLQLTASNGLATPVDWKLGERVIVGPSVKTEDAQVKFEEFQQEEMPSGKPYLRSVKCPHVSSVPATTVPTSDSCLATISSTPPVNPLKIGATIPNFPVKTTKGDFSLHDFLLGKEEQPWSIFFSHPKDFTPVCTTELGACHLLAERFSKMATKLIGISCDSIAEHNGWTKDVLHRINKADEDSLAFPMIADADRSIVAQLGMLDPEERDAAGVPLPARALVILHKTTVRLTILYPATTGRNFDEVFRALTSLQLTNSGLATPVDWTYGQRVIVGPSVPTEEAKEKFQDFQQEEMPSGKPYLRSVKCPEHGV
eukprot:TRINITY_DN49270_c0_g1_i1.p1 TRINITY_DN49270_c0_g1~~TRINITY_DN49270_c0_g1_i1.p1  ORF type:complete len:504 (-),score=77.18 TRINITY_DN49270_c0_g1_i1:105-1616(-)